MPRHAPLVDAQLRIRLEKTCAEMFLRLHATRVFGRHWVLILSDYTAEPDTGNMAYKCSYTKRELIEATENLLERFKTREPKPYLGEVSPLAFQAAFDRLSSYVRENLPGVCAQILVGPRWPLYAGMTRREDGASILRELLAHWKQELADGTPVV